jgi:hypothetical protein
LKLKFLFLLFLYQSATGTKSGPEDDYSIIVNLTDEWYTYNENSKTYLPFIEGISSETPVLTTFINTKKYKHFVLLARSVSPDNYLFINGQFYTQLKEGEWLTLPIANINTKEQQIAVSFYGSINPKSKQLFIGSLVDNSSESTGIVRENFLKMKSRINFPNLNGFISLFIILILFVTIISNNNPKAFNEYFNLKDIFITKIRDTRYLVSKPLNQTNLVYLTLLAFVLSLFYLLMTCTGVHIFQKQIISFGIQENVSFILLFIKALVISFAIYLAKYFLLSIAGSLFGIGKTVNIHYFKIKQYSLLFLSIFTFVFYAVVLAYPTLSNIRHILIWASVLYFGLRTVLIYITILKSSDIQSQYLFAYLCVVEIIPIFIGIKFAF